MITSILFVLLYALVALLVLALCFYIIEKFIAIPQPIKQLIYAIVGVLVIIQLVQVLLGSPPLFRIR